MRILLVEENIIIGDEIVKKLSHMGNTIEWFKDGEVAKNVLFNEHYDAVILGLNLVATSMTILKHWRDHDINTPVLVLTAQDQQTVTLNPRTEDSLKKPFELQDLIARLNSLLRKNNVLNNGTYSFANQLAAVAKKSKLNLSNPSLEYGALKLDILEKKAQIRGKIIDLSMKEWYILELFLTHPRQLLTPNMIEDEVYNYNPDIDNHAIEIHINNLRKKTKSGLIVTKKGLGYMLGQEP